MKAFKLLLRNAATTHFTQIIVLRNFNLSDIAWSTGMSTCKDILHNEFTETVRDNFL